MIFEISDIKALYDKVVAGDRVALGRAITLVESSNPDHRNLADSLLDLCLQTSTNTIRFAISGSPGVGKSTLIEALGQQITDNGETLAVLTIDPTSTRSGGAILGDKTRMPKLAVNPSVFIRPSASRKTLGGVADRTREVIALCEAAGYKNICIETVGVGQSEVDAHDLSDIFILVIGPGGGDDLQGIKKGIVELSDIIAINKADGDMKTIAEQTRQYYIQASRLFRTEDGGSGVQVVTCSSVTGSGVPELWQLIRSSIAEAKASGNFNKRRQQQSVKWFERRAANLILDKFSDIKALSDSIEMLRSSVNNNTTRVPSAIASLSEKIDELISGL